MNVKEQEHCKRVAALGCYICGAEPQLHHIRNDGTGNAGIGRKNSHFSVIPLCYNHHLGPFSIHNKKPEFEGGQIIRSNFICKNKNYVDSKSIIQ